MSSKTLRPESDKRFQQRCEEATGLKFAQIPTETVLAHRGLSGQISWGCLPGTILCKRGDQWLCTNNYPDWEDEDGCDRWDARPENFVLIHLSDEVGYDAYSAVAAQLMGQSGPAVIPTAR